MTSRSSANAQTNPSRPARAARPAAGVDGAGSAMRFQYRGAVYEADQMRFYPCDAPDVLGVYATPDYDLVVVVALDLARGGLRACRVDRDQIERLAACLGAPDLLNALSR